MFSIGKCKTQHCQNPCFLRYDPTISDSHQTTKQDIAPNQRTWDLCVGLRYLMQLQPSPYLGQCNAYIVWMTMTSQDPPLRGPLIGKNSVLYPWKLIPTPSVSYKCTAFIQPWMPRSQWAIFNENFTSPDRELSSNLCRYYVNVTICMYFIPNCAEFNQEQNDVQKMTLSESKYVIKSDLPTLPP